MTPSVGRIVHFVDGITHYAALVVAVWSDTCVNLVIFAGNGDQMFRSSITRDDTASSETWHWPERVE
jgi:hypothetical protein